jgi:hypothetical protein
MASSKSLRTSTPRKKWFEENDSEVVAFEYEVWVNRIGRRTINHRGACDRLERARLALNYPVLSASRR